MSTPDRPQLTPRQWQVLERLAVGEDNAAIAAALGVSGSIVSDALTAIYRRVPRVEQLGKRAAVAAWYRTVGRAQQVPVEPRPGAVGPDVLEGVPDSPAASAPPLTLPQWQILALLAGGANDREIAAVVGLTHVAVSHRLSALYRLLPLGAATNRRAAAAVWYLREGWALRPESAPEHPSK